MVYNPHFHVITGASAAGKSTRLAALASSANSFESFNKDIFRMLRTVVEAQWRLLTRGVAGADSITVVGYGFPPEDGDGRLLLREAMKARGGRQLAVECFELPDRAAETEANIRTAFARWFRPCSAVVPAGWRVARGGRRVNGRAGSADVGGR